MIVGSTCLFGKRGCNARLLIGWLDTLGDFTSTSQGVCGVSDDWECKYVLRVDVHRISQDSDGNVRFGTHHRRHSQLV